MPFIRLLIIAILIVTGATLFVDREEAMETAIIKAHEVKVAYEAPHNEPVKEAESEDTGKLKDFTDKLYQLKLCYESNCDFPETNPLSYERALAHEIGIALNALTWFVVHNRVEDRVINDLAQEFVTHQDSFVQEAALALMATQPPDRGNLEAVLQGIDVADQDPDFIERTLKELERYTAYADLQLIHERLTKAMLDGAPFVAREVSARMVPFITDWSIPYFKSVVKKMPEDSVNRDNLEAAISVVQ